jgi:hypothetical protein
MILSTDIFRREKRDGRNPSTGAKTSDGTIKETEVKKKKMKVANNNE